MNLALKALGEKAGLRKRLHAHVFRHTCATALLNNGVDIKTVQEKLCHANLDTTAIYLHVSDKKLQDVTKGLMI